MKFTTTFATFAAAFLTYGARAADDGAIVGGENVADASLYPFMVSLQRSSGSHFCGGFLVADNIVMTAAHCMGSSNFKVRVKGTAGLRTSDGELFNVKQVFKHPGYNSVTSGNDIALIEIEGSSTATPSVFDVSNNLYVGEDVMAIGWGTLSSGGSTPEILQQVIVPVQSNEQCNVAYNGQITADMICAGLQEGGKDSCQGDSGGPLFLPSSEGPVVVGIVSWGYGCANPGGEFGVYARVNEFTEWITKTIDFINGVTQAPTFSPTVSPTYTGQTYAPTSSVCKDTPEGWYDSDGATFDCEWYAVGNRCAQYGDSYANNGVTANMACCACGGGSFGGNKASAPVSDKVLCQCAGGIGKYQQCTREGESYVCLVDDLTHSASVRPKCVAPGKSELKFSTTYQRWYAEGCAPSYRIPGTVVDQGEVSLVGDNTNVAVGPSDGTGNTQVPQGAEPQDNTTVLVVTIILGCVAAASMITTMFVVVKLQQKQQSDKFAEFRMAEPKL